MPHFCILLIASLSEQEGMMALARGRVSVGRAGEKGGTEPNSCADFDEGMINCREISLSENCRRVLPGEFGGSPTLTQKAPKNVTAIEKIAPVTSRRLNQ
jgi:hypothetical protein